MNKEIYFCVDAWSFEVVSHYVHEQRGANWTNCFRGECYEPTEYAIKQGYKIIVTCSLAHLSFDLIDKGYDIYLCYKDKEVQIKKGMQIPHGILFRTYDIFTLFKNGEFDELLGIEKGE